jgi:tetratricopeptide (TPR) repeat protein
LTSRAYNLTEQENAPEALELMRRCWYYRGVSFYNAGSPRECARSYFRIVESSANDSVLGILSLGYFAHCLIQIDIDNAVKYGAEGVKLARLVDNEPLLAKNLTSHAEAVTYAKKWSQAEDCFLEAAKICRDQKSTSTGGRELGRLMGGQAALLLARGEYKRSVQMAEEAMTVSKDYGDYRRVACARQYRAIGLYANGAREEAMVEMRESILSIPVENGRYSIPPLLTLAKWKDSRFSGALDSLSEASFNSAFATPYLLAARHLDGTADYVRFWQDSYWPILCT